MRVWCVMCVVRGVCGVWWAYAVCGVFVVCECVCWCVAKISAGASAAHPLSYMLLMLHMYHLAYCVRN